MSSPEGRFVMKRASALAAVVAGVVVMVTALAGIAFAGPHYSGWATAQKVDEIAGNSSEVNTTSLDGCPHQSPDGLSLYMASNRPRFVGDPRTDLDIWVAHRATKDAPWGAPQNLGEPINSTADDFCPTPIRGGDLFFVSREALTGACGMGDIYFARSDHRGGWREPKHLTCGPAGPNSSLDEQGPSYVRADGRRLLYFSSGPDIYVSERGLDGRFGPAAPVAELNSTAIDIQPNVRKDGLEVVFASTRRAGTDQDLYGATRESVNDPFSAPVNLGDAVNTTDKNETRPSFSRDAQTLYFGRTPGPEGSTDIFVTTRDKLAGSSG
jgi:hypothetical protein